MQASATHNRAGEITYCHVSGNTYSATVTTYTRDVPGGTITHSLYLYWGDGDSSIVVKTDSTRICDSITMNHYYSTHTYAGTGTYTLSITNPNRVADVCNIVNSVNIPFSINSTIYMPDPQFYGFNCSAAFYNSPVVYAQANKPLTYNANGNDPDGDSLSYRLVAPYYDRGQQMSVPAMYTFPSGLNINPSNGEIKWNNPVGCFFNCGVFNIAYEVREWRKDAYGKAKLVGIVIRDMQIIISCIQNDPPQITPINEICMWAGTTKSVVFTASDPNSNQYIVLSANGIPFTSQVSSPASFNCIPKKSNTSGLLVWSPSCADLKAFPYQIVIHAIDSAAGTGNCGDQNGMNDLTVKVKVIAPPPINLNATPGNNLITLTWQNPYLCSTTNKFRSFSLWRKIGCDNTILDSCQQGMQGLGYTQIAANITTYSFIDVNVLRGQTYTYRVVGEFNDVSPGGYAYNKFSGHPSDPVCVSLKLDKPVLINASVINTDASKGMIFVRWIRPQLPDFDTLLNPPPYLFNIFHGPTNSNTSTLVKSYTFNSYHSIRQNSDTSFVDTALQTSIHPYAYAVQLKTQGGIIDLGKSDAASSPWLIASPSNKALSLQVIAQTVWVNDSMTIFKKNTSTGIFDSLTTVAGNIYKDNNLINGQSYCYKVKTIGHFTSPKLPRITYNFSQEICAIPHDTIAPCAPTLTVANACSDNNSGIDDEFNHLKWTMDNLPCNKDLLGYYIYYAPNSTDPLQLVDTVKPANNKSYKHNYQNAVAGCYALVAFDSAYNNSIQSNIVCMDNCSNYTLPNVFTPNGDGHNDLYHPFLPYSFIDHVEMNIYNKWGGLIFETQDPMINWDGTDQKSGKVMQTGTYYYKCRVFEIQESGVIERKKPLSGYIELVR